MENLQIVPAAASGKNVEAQYVEMMVPLYSYGCEKKVKKALANRKGIYSVNVDFRQQKVIVWGICDKHDVLDVVKSKRKGARFWVEEDVVQLQESHSAPPSPPPPLRKTSTRYLAMIKGRSFNLSLDMMKSRSLSWKLDFKKTFARSNSF